MYATEAQRMFADQIRLDPSFGGLSFLFGEGSGPLRRGVKSSGPQEICFPVS